MKTVQALGLDEEWHVPRLVEHIGVSSYREIDWASQRRCKGAASDGVNSYMEIEWGMSRYMQGCCFQ